MKHEIRRNGLNEVLLFEIADDGLETQCEWFCVKELLTFVVFPSITAARSHINVVVKRNKEVELRKTFTLVETVIT